MKRSAAMVLLWLAVVFAGCGEGFFAVACFADDGEVGLGVEDHAQSFADEFLVVGNDDRDHGVSASGSRAWTA